MGNLIAMCTGDPRGLTKYELEELAGKTHFTKKELQDWNRNFLKDCPTGRLNKDEFGAVYGQIFPNGDPSKFSTFVFNVFDRDHSGSITFDEFIMALSVTMRGDMDEKLDWAFQLYDIDHSGCITRREMVKIVGAIYEMVGEEEFASEGATREENTPEGRVEVIFQLMDKNNDGLISKEEFKSGSKSDPWIFKALSLDLSSITA